MENFILSLVTNPLLYIEYGLSFLAAVGIVIFIAGFAGAFPHLFTYSEGAEHMDHARTRILWGVYLCMVAFGIWEFIRVLLGEAPHSTLILCVILLSPLWAPWIKKTLTGSPGGGH